jgi:membrane protein required for colicin V production
MTGFDIAVLVLVGLGIFTGLLRGFVHEVLALAAWAIALFAIHTFHTPLSVWLEPQVGSRSGATVLAFALLMLVPYGLVKLLANRLGEASRQSVLGPIDRLLGAGFGAVKGMVITVLAFSVLVLGYDTVWGAGGRPDWLTQARAYPFVNASSESLVKMIAERRKEAAAAEAERLDQAGA